MVLKARKKLGEILIETGIADEAQVDSASDTASATGKKLGEVLIEEGIATEEQIAQSVATQFGIEFIDLTTAAGLGRIDPELIDGDIIRKHLVLPLEEKGGRITLVAHDPSDLGLIDTLSFRLGKDIDLVIGSRGQIKSYIDDLGGGMKREISGDDSTIDKSDDRSVDREQSVDSIDASVDVDVDGDSKIVALANKIIKEAVRGRSSDIHFEPMVDRVRLRYRIDGICHERHDIAKSLQASLLARLKLMAGVNVAERRIPQDGRIKMPIAEESGGEPVDIDFRVSFCPAYHGESVVLRVLRPDSVRIGLANIGFEPDNLQIFERIIKRPNGIFLVTGPTGSGKTTTLYSALDTLNTPNRKIITAEDPVEYNFSGINQVQVRDSIGLSFTAILRAMLRQAPNVILVGEIRDREVADIAIQASLTGHLVFSTLHTNDAPSAITRLIDIGVKPFLVASSIQAIMAQRLIRILCPKCAVADEAPDPRYLKLVNISPDEVEAGNIRKAVGCPNCGGTGYRGRKAIFELMRMNAEVRELAFERAQISKIREAAIRGGMRSLLGDGKVKILRGDTTPEEIAKFAQIEGFNPNEI
ncbi:MAG: pilus assembly protein PilB [Phycisphaerae bacterium]|nr:pilus assembly protein PilB [Phycisphaerae bacterium]